MANFRLRELTEPADFVRKLLSNTKYLYCVIMARQPLEYFRKLYGVLQRRFAKLKNGTCSDCRSSRFLPAKSARGTAPSQLLFNTIYVVKHKGLYILVREQVSKSTRATSVILAGKKVVAVARRHFTTSFRENVRKMSSCRKQVLEGKLILLQLDHVNNVAQK